MIPLKIGRNYLSVDRIESIVTPSTQGNQTNAALVRFVSGREEAFHGEEADAIRDWLAEQVKGDPVKPATVPFVHTKSDAKAVTKR